MRNLMSRTKFWGNFWGKEKGQQIWHALHERTFLIDILICIFKAVINDLSVNESPWSMVGVFLKPT